MKTPLKAKMATTGPSSGLNMFRMPLLSVASMVAKLVLVTLLVLVVVMVLVVVVVLVVLLVLASLM